MKLLKHWSKQDNFGMLFGKEIGISFCKSFSKWKKTKRKETRYVGFDLNVSLWWYTVIISLEEIYKEEVKK